VSGISSTRAVKRTAARGPRVAAYIALAMRTDATLLSADRPDFEPAARGEFCAVQFIG